MVDEWGLNPILKKFDVKNDELLTELNQHFDKRAGDFLKDRKAAKKAAYREIYVYVMQKQIDISKQKGKNEPLDDVAEMLDRLINDGEV